MQNFVQDVLSGELFTRQLTSVQLIHIGFKQGFGENPVATLSVLGVSLFMLALLCRYLVYGIVRVTGREKYDNRSRAIENLWSLIALGFGFVAGEVCFQNLWLAVLTGFGYAVISIGAVLEALVANEKNRISRLSRGLSVGSRLL